MSAKLDEKEVTPMPPDKIHFAGTPERGSHPLTNTPIAEDRHIRSITRRARLGDEYAAMTPKLSIAERSQNPVLCSKELKDKILRDLESELGRMAKLIGQLRAEFLRASD